jgi:uncharacterized membrane protein YcaP (DUF421 family)
VHVIRERTADVSETVEVEVADVEEDGALSILKVCVKRTQRGLAHRTDGDGVVLT